MHRVGPEHVPVYDAGSVYHLTHYVYAASTAATMYTSTADIVRFLQAHFANSDVTCQADESLAPVSYACERATR